MDKILYPIKINNKFLDKEFSIIVNKYLKTFYLKSKYRINLFSIYFNNDYYFHIRPSRYIDDKKYDIYDKSYKSDDIFTYKITFKSHINIRSIDFDYDYHGLSNLKENYDPMLSVEYDNEDIIFNDNNIITPFKKFLYFSLEDYELFTINKINKTIGSKSFTKIQDTEYDLKYMFTDKYCSKYFKVVFNDTYYDNLVENDEVFADFNGSSIYPRYDIDLKIL